MKSLILTFFCSILALILPAQTELDTTIYNVADQMPFPYIKSCMPERNPSWEGNLDSIRRCAETQFFSILANNIRYPEEARINNLQGSVVVSCVIEPNSGRMTNLSILKDIGGGCGDEALRVLQA
ncbi:MAG: energy transducer TonB, partial [Saprospiraceae bacterium]|nr:energy transducer TonB [Saprospiraceae bacterium]